MLRHTLAFRPVADAEQGIGARKKGEGHRYRTTDEFLWISFLGFIRISLYFLRLRNRRSYELKALQRSIFTEIQGHEQGNDFSILRAM